MRCFQLVLGYGLAREENTAKSFIWASIGLTIIVYLICTAMVYNIADHETRKVQNSVINDTLGVIMIELFLWDMLLMPLLLALLVTGFKRRGLTKHFKGCTV